MGACASADDVDDEDEAAHQVSLADNPNLEPLKVANAKARHIPSLRSQNCISPGCIMEPNML